jgi:quercetin dioxygenase-like cupin family protein
LKKIVLPNFIELAFRSEIIAIDDHIQNTFDLGSCYVQIFDITYKPGTIKETHVHDEYRITFVRSGKAKFVLENKTTEVDPGYCISLLPNTPHGFEVISQEPLTIVEVIFQPLEDDAKD